jgi:hypothetical protein
MKTMFGSLMLSTGVLSLAAMSVQAQEPMAMEFGPSELMTCTYNEGKDSDDFEKLTDAFTKWVKKNDPDYTYYALASSFHEDSSAWDVGILGIWNSGTGWGKGYDAWMSDDDDVGAMFADVMECNNSLAAVTEITSRPETGPWDTGVVWFSRCEMEDDVTLVDAIGAHRAQIDAAREMGEDTVSWAFLPALGFGDAEFDYYQVQAWPSYSEIGGGFDNFFNKGGWKYQEAVGEKTSCSSPNLYNFRTMYTPGS